jgi:hypothetical protein
MRTLLERAGLRIRGATRADCTHCEGRSRGTVSFTSEVAFCHRCKWQANKSTLARDLGLLCGNPEAASAFREEARVRERLHAEIKPFENWRDAKIRHISERYRLLARVAIRASEVLLHMPDCDEAWDALARFYHAEAQLSAAFDWLIFAKASVWIEADSSAAKVYETWRSDVA